MRVHLVLLLTKSLQGFPPGLPTADEQILGERAVTLIYDGPDPKRRVVTVHQ